MDIIREIERQSVGHQLAAEHYERVDNVIKLTATILSAVAASSSYWAMHKESPITGYIIASTATMTAIVNAIISTGRYAKSGSDHGKVAKQLENLRLQYIDTLSDADTPTLERERLVHQLRLAITAILKDAPLVPSQFDKLAAVKAKYHDEHRTAVTLVPRQIHSQVSSSQSQSQVHSASHNDTVFRNCELVVSARVGDVALGSPV